MSICGEHHWAANGVDCPQCLIRQHGYPPSAPPPSAPALNLRTKAMTTLGELAAGRPYECGGKTLPNTVFIDPTRVVAIKAEVMGRMRSVIFLEGGHTIGADMTPEETAAALTKLQEGKDRG